MLTPLERFAYQTWKRFDKLLASEMPNLSIQCRVELAQNWGKHISRFEHMYEDISRGYASKSPCFYEEPTEGVRILWGAEVEEELGK